MLRIGISAGIEPPNPHRQAFTKKSICYVEQQFAQYFAQFGVLPILIPDLPLEHLTPFMQELDGLVLQGGTDISPQRYKEDDALWKGDTTRDNYEWQVLELAMQLDLPILGVCRGFQLLNVYFGGSLYQDLPSQSTSSVIHRDRDLYDGLFHPITLVKEELLDQLNICKQSNLTNSIHHQGIKTLGKNLVPLAHAEDGLIEAFYWNQRPKGYVLGVQWHPDFFGAYQDKLLNNSPIIELYLEHSLKRKKQ